MVKVCRKEPEFVGGPTVAMVSEDSLKEAMDNGWTPVKDEKPAKTEAKPEPKTEVKEAPETEVKADKPKTKKKLD